MYSKILVPIDGSKTADKALEHAINLVKSISSNSSGSRNNRAKIIILYVIPELPVPLGFEKPMRSLKTGKMISLSEYIKEMHESIKSNAKEMLEKRKKKYGTETNGSNSNFTIITEVFVGDRGISISNTIIEFAVKEKVDLIVVGAVGLSGISKIKVLGRISRAITERSSCPVLIVH
jgi:nucleotide-binding universal stress UspA family protein